MWRVEVRKSLYVRVRSTGFAGAAVDEAVVVVDLGGTKKFVADA